MQQSRMLSGKRELMQFFGIGEKKLMKWIKELDCPAYPDTQGVYRAWSGDLTEWYAEAFGPSPKRDDSCRLS
ncbi:hypothetical protein [Desulfobaculum sp.]|jgi:hypothetical protein